MTLTIIRPNGSTYRPRKLRAQILGNEDEVDGVVVLGTHDLHDARALAERELATSCEGWYRLAPNDPGKRVWYRQALAGFFEDQPLYHYIDDEEYGAAGVLFDVRSPWED